MQEAAALLWNGTRSFQGGEPIGVEGIGSSVAEVAWVPRPGDLRKALVDRRREVICGRLNWAAVVGRSFTTKRKSGGDMEMKYDVGFDSKST